MRTLFLFIALPFLVLLAGCQSTPPQKTIEEKPQPEKHFASEIVQAKYAKDKALQMSGKGFRVTSREVFDLHLLLKTVNEDGQRVDFRVDKDSTLFKEYVRFGKDSKFYVRMSSMPHGPEVWTASWLIPTPMRS